MAPLYSLQREMNIEHIHLNYTLVYICYNNAIRTSLKLK